MSDDTEREPLKCGQVELVWDHSNWAHTFTLSDITVSVYVERLGYSAYVWRSLGPKALWESVNHQTPEAAADALRAHLSKLATELTV